MQKPSLHRATIPLAGDMTAGVPKTTHESLLNTTRKADDRAFFPEQHPSGELFAD
jgi:hypothetical protein